MGAVHTLKTIHRSILLRLLSVWLLVTPLAAGLGYWIEVGKFEEDLVALVSQHLENVLADVQNNNRGDEKRYRAMREFIGRNYLFMRIIDDSGKVLEEGDNPAHEALTGKLRTRFAPLPQDGRRHVSRLEIDGVSILRVTINLPAGVSGRKFSLEGAFIIDAQELQRQRDKLWRFLGGIVLVSLATTLALYPVILSLNRNVLRASREILQGNIETAAVLGAAIAKRDSDTGEHNYRVTLYAIALAEKVGLSREQIRDLTLGAFLHDVGKIGIPDAILLKPGRLDEAEFAAMKQHVGLGLEIIANSRWLAPAVEVIGNHHEKVDGSGYPQGLQGEEIPLNARVFAIVDVFDALMSKRPYKPPMALVQALEILRAGRGQHFDSALVDAFCDIADDRYRALCDLSESALSEILVAHVSRHFL